MPERAKSPKRYFVYEYHHVDDLGFLRRPEDVDPMIGLAKQAEIEELFRQHGWEGDGQVSILWFPPFVSVGPENTWGTYVWFVKQSNNGTAFMASEYELPFPRLYAQNRDFAVRDGMYPEGLARVSREALEEALDTILPELETDLAAVSALPAGSLVANHLIERAQGRMVQTLMALLDDCYLRILIEVIQDGNRSNLRLRKSRANLSPGDYLSEDMDGDVRGWFTLSGLISDLWASYKFEPYAAKLDMLLKPIELQPPADLMFELRKHVLMRNAIQHHEGWISQPLLTDLGRPDIPVLTPAGPGALKIASAIVLPIEEIRAFDRALRTFAALLDERVEERVASKAYSRRKPLRVPS